MKYLTLKFISCIFSFFKGYKIEPCRNCKSEVKPKIARCPYCGILNPTIKLKEIFINIFLVIAVMAVITYFVN